MELSPEDSAKISTLHEDYRTLQDAMWSAESNKEQLCLAFREDLDGKVTALRKQVLDIRLMAQHDMLLDPTTDMHEAHVCFFCLCFLALRLFQAIASVLTFASGMHE